MHGFSDTQTAKRPANADLLTPGPETRKEVIRSYEILTTAIYFT